MAELENAAKNVQNLPVEKGGGKGEKRGKKEERKKKD